jgi:hypothetical protein
VEGGVTGECISGSGEVDGDLESTVAVLSGGMSSLRSREISAFRICNISWAKYFGSGL